MLSKALSSALACDGFGFLAYGLSYDFPEAAGAGFFLRRGGISLSALSLHLPNGLSAHLSDDLRAGLSNDLAFVFPSGLPAGFPVGLPDALPVFWCDGLFELDELDGLRPRDREDRPTGLCAIA